jgi:hypothetical protein
VQLMTQAEFARHRGVSKGSVTNWKNAKLLVMAEGPNGKPMVDVVRTELKLNANIDPMRGRPSTGGSPQLQLRRGAKRRRCRSPKGRQRRHRSQARRPGDERVQHLREQRIGQALKNAQLAGELVPLIEAERRVAKSAGRRASASTPGCAAIAEQFAAEKDVRQIMRLGEKGIDEVFAQLADAADRGDFAGDDDEPT